MNKVTVTRLIRIAYGDYVLRTIPPGMAIEVPYKPVETQKARGALRSKVSTSTGAASRNATVKWIRSVR